MNIILDAGYYCGEVGDGLALSDIIRNLNETVKRKRMEGKRKTTYLKGFFDLRKRIYENPKKKVERGRYGSVYGVEPRIFSAAL